MVELREDTFGDPNPNRQVKGAEPKHQRWNGGQAMSGIHEGCGDKERRGAKALYHGWCARVG
jgi:hypothetical protein